MARSKAQSYPRVRRRLNGKRKDGSKSYSWIVDLSKQEPRLRIPFKTKDEAEIFAAQKRASLQTYGTAWDSMPEQIKAEAADLWKRLQPFGVTLKSAVNFYFEHARPDAGERSVQEVIDEMLRKRKEAGRSAGYLQVQRSVFKTFANAFAGKTKFGDRKIHTIMSRDIEEWIASRVEWASRTRRNYQRDLATLWNFAIRNKFAAHNPLEQLEAPSVPSDPPGILTVEEAQKLLLAAASAPDRRLLPYIAIGLFAGLRPTEIERLDWSEIDLSAKLIEVTAKKAKTRQRRHVTISSTLLGWLKQTPGRSGRVAPPCAYKSVVDLAKNAGTLIWPHNALRHSFASYHLAKHKDAARTALELGHNNQDLLFRNYRELVKPAQANAYWKLLPKKNNK